MSRFYPPKKKGPTGPSSVPEDCLMVRFVLKSGAALELTEDSIDEVIGTWADRACKAICGCKQDGTKVVIPLDSVDYMEDVK